MINEGETSFLKVSEYWKIPSKFFAKNNDSGFSIFIEAPTLKFLSNIRNNNLLEWN